MPELPEVEVTRLALLPALHGASLIGFYKSRKTLREKMPSLAQVKPLLYQPVQKLSRHGKFLFIHFYSQVIVIHLGMSGVLTFAQERRKHDHCILTFKKKGASFRLAFNDPRRFGLLILRDSKITFINEKMYGGDALTIQPAHFFEKIKNRTINLKAMLLNQQIIAGIGNIYASEILYMAKLHPCMAANTLVRSKCRRLLSASKAVLRNAISCGGTTLRDFNHPDGSVGYFSIQHKVYGRESQPCPKCRTPIERIIQQNRSTYFCPNCQY